MMQTLCALNYNALILETCLCGHLEALGAASQFTVVLSYFYLSVTFHHHSFWMEWVMSRFLG